MIDQEKIIATIMARAERGVRRATAYGVERAKHHAPVRKIFKGSTRGPEGEGRGFNVGKSGQFVSTRPMRTRTAYQAFLQSNRPTRRVDINPLDFPGDTGGQMLAAQTSTVRSGIGRLGGRHGSFRGHSSSLFPVFRDGKFRVTGDFRRLGPVGGAVRQRGSKVTDVPAVEAERMRTSRLTKEGRFEVARARKPGGGLFQGRVGGRLRGEIHMSGPFDEGGILSYAIVSPTKYAVYQEFGTTRHRSQPFLRPALYESRNVLRSEVRRAVKSPAYLRGVPTSLFSPEEG